MIKIKLERSGGMLGKTLESTKSIDFTEEEIAKKLVKATPLPNENKRDDYYHSITINDTVYDIDVSLLKGALKKIVTTMESKLALPPEKEK